MKPQVKNLDDIVFEVRNKLYGAYHIRKNYNKTLAKAVFFAVLLFLGVISIPLLAGLKKEADVDINVDYPGVDMDLPVDDNTKDIDLPEKQEIERVEAYTAPLVVDSVIDNPADLMALIDGTGNSDPTDGEGTGIAFEPTDQNPITDFHLPEQTFTVVEIMPTFTGGIEALYKWLGENVIYPQIAKENGIQGIVMVTFVVEKDGDITNVDLLSDIGGGCGDEAVRVVKKMPKWKEGRQNGIPVRVQFNLPVRFVLE